MRIKIDGHNLPVKNLDTSRIRYVAELQQQSGWKLPEIRAHAAAAESINAAILSFLSLRNEGIATTWEEMLDRTFEDIQIVADPGDSRKAEAPTTDPQEPSGASAPDAAPEAEATQPGA